MTGRELIIYILENNLEDEVIFKNGTIIGFVSLQEAAVKFGVGTSTVATWVKLNMINHIFIGDAIYIPVNAERPKGGI